jgi:hypothetical protein
MKYTLEGDFFTLNKIKVTAIVFICISMLLLVACKDISIQKEDEQEVIAEMENENIDISVLSNFECFFSSFEPSCIQFELVDKDKLILFFDGQQIDTGQLEPKTKPIPKGMFSNSPFTIFWTDVTTGEVVYEISYSMSIIISNKKTTREIHYIELTDYKNDRKLFLDNSSE